MGGTLERIQEVHLKACKKAKPDLSSPYASLQIAETYKQARKHDLALEWAERGVKAFPERFVEMLLNGR